MKRRFSFLYLHPFLLGVYPVLALLGHNVVQVYHVDALRPLLIMLGITGILWGFMWLICRDWGRAGLATSFLLFLFLIYVNLTQVRGENRFLAVLLKDHKVLLSFFGVLALLGIGWFRRGGKFTMPLTQLFFTVGSVAIFFPVSQIVSYDVTDLVMDVSNEEVANIDQPEYTRNGYPDIYFIVLDAYARDDVLAEVYDFDNTPFLTELEKLGFYVPVCNLSNYSKTAFSISSTLNLNYLDVLGEGEAKNTLMDRDLIRDNEVRRLLTEWGYKTVAFPTGYVWSEINTAEVFLNPEDDNLRTIGPWQPLEEINPFETLFLKSSFRPILDLLSFLGVNIRLDRETENIETAIEMKTYYEYFERAHFALDALEKIPYIPGPKFVYAHIVSPHPPYVMNRYGEFELNQDRPKYGYIEQVTYLNDRMLIILKLILNKSKTPPIVILEGDHGAKAVEWTPEVMKNLSAYYFPVGGNEHLYNTITPVNSFRIMFDYYFGTDLGKVEDISYNSLSDDNQLNFEIIPNTCERESHP